MKCAKSLDWTWMTLHRSGLDSSVRSGLFPESTATEELFDPARGTFTATSMMANPRARHTATLLPGGEVLVTGGTLSENSTQAYFLSSAELFQ